MRSTFVSFSEMKMVDISRRQFLIKNFRELHRVSEPLTRVAHTSTRRVPYVFPLPCACGGHRRARVRESESNTHTRARAHMRAYTRTASRPNIHGIWLRYVTHTYAAESTDRHTWLINAYHLAKPLVRAWTFKDLICVITLPYIVSKMKFIDVHRG